MMDPLSEIVSLLQPSAVFAKGISGAGRWAVRYSQFDNPGFCTVLEGLCRLRLDGEDAVTLMAGDFVLLPSTPGFILSGLEPATPIMIDPKSASVPVGEVRHGDLEGVPDVRLLGGSFVFDSPNAALLTSGLPKLIHLRGAERLATLVRLVGEEAPQQMAGRDFVVTRLVELLLIEALRAIQTVDGRTGLLRALADPRLAPAIRRMHAEPARSWTVAELASEAALSRSAFFDRFMRVVGTTPMDYLIRWRMALAKDMLRRTELALGQVAEKVGYASQSTFSAAFTRHVGQSPGRFARAVSS